MPTYLNQWAVLGSMPVAAFSYRPIPSLNTANIFCWLCSSSPANNMVPSSLLLPNTPQKYYSFIKMLFSTKGCSSPAIPCCTARHLYYFGYLCASQPSLFISSSNLCQTRFGLHSQWPGTTNQPPTIWHHEAGRRKHPQQPIGGTQKFNKLILWCLNRGQQQ